MSIIGGAPGGMGGPGANNPNSSKNSGKAGGGKDVSNPYDSRLRNPRYEKKKTKAFEATMSNLAQVGGTVLGALSGPIGTAVNTAAQTIAGVDPLNPFEKPVGDTDGFTYDKGSAQDSEINKPDVAKLAPAKKKKTKPVVKGFTLLEDVGGTLLGT
jgi:hypothetical protein